MDDIAIKVDSVSKTFKLPHEKRSSIKSAFVNIFRPQKGYEMQKALKDVSFEVKQGEFFGIVGRNGSGKSTLLKLLAGIYSPTSGDVQVNGKLTPFIELGVGFNPELTGRENVYLNGALLGFNRKEMQAMYKDIVDFAELEKFMDQKLKNYSSGMQVRLAFSIAIRAKSDILLIDEVLAVGDASFQKKCFEYFYELKRKGRTVVFVSHDLEAVQKFCTRAVWIDRGVMKTSGSAQEVTNEYKVKTFEEERKNQTERRSKGNLVGDIGIDIKGSRTFKHTDKLKLTFSYELLREHSVEIGLVIVKDGVGFAHMSTLGEKLNDKPGKYEAELDISLSYLMDGEYNIHCGVFDSQTRGELAFKAGAASFFIKDNDPAKFGIVRLDCEWSRLPRAA